MQVCRCFAMIVYRLQCTGLGEWCNYLNIPPVVINCPTNLRDMREKGVHKGRQFPKVRPSESSAKGGETSEFEEVSFRSPLLITSSQKRRYCNLYALPMLDQLGADCTTISCLALVWY